MSYDDEGRLRGVGLALVWIGVGLFCGIVWGLLMWGLWGLIV